MHHTNASEWGSQNLASRKCRKIDLALGTGRLRLVEGAGGLAPALRHIQLLKSISATLVVVAGSAFNGAPVESFATICSDGVQSGVPPLRGTAALASTVKSTSPVAGVE